MTYHFDIPGNPITKKNSQKIIRLGNGRTIIKPSDSYDAYESTAVYYLLQGKPPEPISSPVQITCVYYMKTRRAVDLTNLLEATDDILVEGKIIADDNRDIVASHDGSRVYHDAQRPRVEIVVTEMNDYGQWRDEVKEKPVKRVRKKKIIPALPDFDEEHWD